MLPNNSGINPKGPRILVLPKELTEKSAGGIVLATDAGREREEMANTTGLVVSMGPECYGDKSSMWCEVGDKIIFAKYAGLLYKGKDGKKYRMINDEDVTGTLDADVELVDVYISSGR